MTYATMKMSTTTLTISFRFILKKYQPNNYKMKQPRRHPCANDINLLRAPCCEFIDIVNKVLAVDDKTMTIACIEEICCDGGMSKLDILMSRDILSFLCDVYDNKPNLKNRMAKNIRTPLKKLAVLGKKYDELPKRGWVVRVGFILKSCRFGSYNKRC